MSNHSSETATTAPSSPDCPPNSPLFLHFILSASGLVTRAAEEIQATALHCVQRIRHKPASANLVLTDLLKYSLEEAHVRWGTTIHRKHSANTHPALHTQAAHENYQKTYWVIHCVSLALMQFGLHQQSDQKEFPGFIFIRRRKPQEFLLCPAAGHSCNNWFQLSFHCTSTHHSISTFLELHHQTLILSVSPVHLNIF